MEDAVQDWGKMLTRAEETIVILQDHADGHAQEAASAVELLRWLIDHHFTFLGFREYKIIEDQAGYHMEPVPATGLGILRGDRDVPGAFQADSHRRALGTT